jgi:hypothetical protein
MPRARRTALLGGGQLQAINALLLEDGFFLLQEDGFSILL